LLSREQQDHSGILITLFKTECTNALLIVNLNSFTKTQWVLGLLIFTSCQLPIKAGKVDQKVPGQLYMSSGHIVQQLFNRFLLNTVWSDAGGDSTDSLVMAYSQSHICTTCSVSGVSGRQVYKALIDTSLGEAQSGGAFLMAVTAHECRQECPKRRPGHHEV